MKITTLSGVRTVRENGKEVSLDRVVHDPRGDIVLSVHRVVAEKFATDPQGRRVGRMMDLVVEDLMDPEVLMHVRAKGNYQGSNLSGVQRFFIMHASGNTTQNVGKPPVLEPDSKTLVFYVNVNLETDTIDQLRGSMRGLLAQPPIEMDFEKTPIGSTLNRAGIIPASVFTTLERKASWHDQDFTHFSGARSILAPLSPPVVVEHPFWKVPVVYRFGKCKAVIRRGGVLQPSSAQFERPLEGKSSRVLLGELDHRGLYVEYEQLNPEGGMTWESARNDALMCNRAYETGVSLDLCISFGRCRDRFSEGKNMGAPIHIVAGDEWEDTFSQRWMDALTPFVSVVDPKTSKLDPEKVFSLKESGGLDPIRMRVHGLFMDYGRLLDRANTAGIFSRAFHFGNVKTYDVDDREIVYGKDFTGALDIIGQPLERQVGYRALTLAFAWLHIDQLPGFETVESQMMIQEMLGFSPYLSLLLGYFSERMGDPRVNPNLREDSCNPWNMGKIISEGRKKPVHELNYPEIALLWDKVRGVPARRKLPLNTTFFFEDGLTLRQNSLPEGVDQKAFEDRFRRLMGHGISWISISACGNEPKTRLNRDQCTLSITVPEKLGPRKTADTILELMDAAMEE